jgi:hypothetical protein
VGGAYDESPPDDVGERTRQAGGGSAVASSKTELTELATAVGIAEEPGSPWLDGLAELDVPGLHADVWQPVVLPVAGAGHRDRDLLLRALANGRAFREHVLRGRRPERIDWTGGTKGVWTSDVPRDLTVDGVWFVQAKYDSTCVLNTAPAVLVDHLLVDDAGGRRLSWYDEVARPQLEAYYRSVRGQAPDQLPPQGRDLQTEQRRWLKAWMRARPDGATPDEEAAYRDLCRAVSLETVLRWRHRLTAATPVQRTQMLFRLLRIAGGPYWLLGAKGTRPVRLRVDDTRTWRERFALRTFTVTDANVGQPQVDWRAEVVEVATGRARPVDGYCEIRWSHGKLQGHPECKVQVTTALDDIPGYEPLS